MKDTTDAPIEATVKSGATISPETMQTFHFNATTKKKCKRFWDFMTDDMKQDRDIALAASIYGHVYSEDLPERWTKEKAFFFEAVSKRSNCWGIR